MPESGEINESNKVRALNAVLEAGLLIDIPDHAIHMQVNGKFKERDFWRWYSDKSKTLYHDVTVVFKKVGWVGDEECQLHTVKYNCGNPDHIHNFIDDHYGMPEKDPPLFATTNAGIEIIGYDYQDQVNWDLSPSEIRKKVRRMMVPPVSISSISKAVLSWQNKHCTWIELWTSCVRRDETYYDKLKSLMWRHPNIPEIVYELDGVFYPEAVANWTFIDALSYPNQEEEGEGEDLWPLA